MNAVAEIAKLPVAHPSEDAVIDVLRNSLYPGAKPESVKLVLAWCKATGRDPMKKPIHIVPMWVKDATTDQGGMRDVLMPGIGTYRSDAASTGQYAGKTEPEFGPDVDLTLGSVRLTVPRWCKVTVHRLVAGQVRAFTAVEFWTENYATAGRNAQEPNQMWRKRPYGQLAKCAEAQALRMAFPDETGNAPTSEEMEGKAFDGVTLDADPVPPRGAAPPTPERVTAPQQQLQNAKRDHEAQRPAGPPQQPRMTIAQFLDGLDNELRIAPDSGAVSALLRSDRVRQAQGTLTGDALLRFDQWLGRAEMRADELARAERKPEPPAPSPAADSPPLTIDAEPAQNITENITQPPAEAGSLTGNLPADIDEWPIAGEENLRG